LRAGASAKQDLIRKLIKGLGGSAGFSRIGTVPV
jgi:hypothetical protein